MACQICNGAAVMQNGVFNHAYVRNNITICRDCCADAVFAWARKAKLMRVPPPTPPKPTGPPTATGEATRLVEALAA